jgi:hypothetical protein
MAFDLDRVTRNFLLSESPGDPDLMGYLQALSETLSSLRPQSRKDERRIQVGIKHLREVKRYVNRMNKKITTLEEQVKVLEEGRNEKDN